MVVAGLIVVGNIVLVYVERRLRRQNKDSGLLGKRMRSIALAQIAYMLFVVFVGLANFSRSDTLFNLFLSVPLVVLAANCVEMIAERNRAQRKR